MIVSCSTSNISLHKLISKEHALVIKEFPDWVELWVNLLYTTECPNKNATFFAKHKTITFCSIVKILFDSKRVCVNLDFHALDSPIVKYSSRCVKDLLS